MSEFNESKAHELEKQQEEVKPQYPYEFRLTTNGKISTQGTYNIRVILENDPKLKDLFKFNDFTQEIDVTRNILELQIKKGTLNDACKVQVSSYIEDKSEYGHAYFKPNLVLDAITTYARENHYNPIKNYFDNCAKEWDGKNRLEDILHKYLGVEKTVFVEWITKLWFVGAVAQIYKPGTKFDQVLDLVGGQGTGKTTFFRKIAPLGYYTDDLDTFTRKDDLTKSLGVVVVNDDELTATKRTSPEELKKFASKQQFKYRLPYGHGVQTFTRMFVFGRTTNERYYLTDLTGNRRFMPVLCDLNKQEHHPADKDGLNSDEVAQLWGEAVNLYKNNEVKLSLNKEDIQRLEDNCRNFANQSSLEEALQDILENNLIDKDFITNEQLKTQLTRYEFSSWSKISKTVKDIMLKYGYEPKSKKISGKTQRGYMYV